jgi:RHS repeat-associated protein
VTASGGGVAASPTTTATIAALPVASAGGPYSGSINTAITFSGAGSTAPSGQTITGYAWTFGDGGTGMGVSPTHTYTSGGSFTVTLTVTDASGGTGNSTSTVNISSVAAPTITGFTPASGPVGTLVTVTGTNLMGQSGSTTQINLGQQGGGSIAAPINALSATSLTFVIPQGAATGAVALSVGGQIATSTSMLTVTTSSSYTVNVSPGTGTLIQGQSTTLAVTISSTNNFSGVANLSVTGVPSGITASFQPTSIAVGQTSVLTLAAPSSQATGTSNLMVSGAVNVDGQAVTQTAPAAVKVTAITTSFLGRTVVDDAAQEPIAGVTVKFLGVDNNGNVTGCSGQTTSDGAGNFILSSLPVACIGPQLISYNGATATAPAGTYAGVNLSYTLVSGQVVASPVLIHLPRIDNAETVQVQQNSPTDQIFYFQTIPGVKVTVYAGTTLTLDDGSQPNPFPLVAISIPLDRLPEKMATNGMLMPFIVAFQPANSVASQPVGVNFPNSLGIAPGTSVTFVTLDPTHGYMVPYGTGTVSSDGTEFIANADPSHPGHTYGLVHFDWHGPASSAPNGNNPGPDGCGPCGGAAGSGGGSNGGASPPQPQEGDPVDVSSGIVTYHATDLLIGGQRGGLSVTRTYRTLTSNVGAFGRGANFQYNMYISTVPLLDGQQLINLVMPDGNQYPLNQQPDGTFINGQIPALRGAVLTGTIGAQWTLTWINGTVYTFTTYPQLGEGQAFLSSITDLSGNTTTLTLNSSRPQQVLSMTDPVGRSLTFAYDSSNRITQVTDPIGRKVQYTYDSASGAIATVTDANGGVTKYTYDSSGNLATITDARGVVIEQNTYNESFDGRITQQVNADGGVLHFAYTLQNPTLATSPVLQTVVTDPLGNQTTYRFNMQGFLVSVADASGQTRTLNRDPAHSNLVSDYTGNGSCGICGNPASGDIHYTFDAVGNLLTRTDSLGNTTKYTYDTRFNKVSSVTDPLGNTTSIVYDANGKIISVTDANGNMTKYQYDQFGEQIASTDPTGATTASTYDAFGNLSSITNALGNTTHLTYDGASRLTQTQDPLGRRTLTTYDNMDGVLSTTDPLGSKSVFTYDAVGGLLTSTDPKGNTTTYTYDSRERLATLTSPLGKTQSYTYDLDSNLTQLTDRRGVARKFAYDVMSRISTATYADATVSYIYDPAGRLLAATDSSDGSFGFQYDLDGRLVQQSEPTGVINYTRDPLGRVLTEQAVGSGSTTYAYDLVGNLLSATAPGASAGYTYDPRNLPLTLTRGNGVLSTSTYDALGELLSLTHTNATSTVLSSQTYTYDTSGVRSLASNNLSTALTTQSAASTVDVDDELLTAGATSYTYDANGSRLTDTTSSATNSYTWDGRGRLKSILLANGSVLALHYNSGSTLLGVTTTTNGSSATQSLVVDYNKNVISLTPSTGLPLSVVNGATLDSHLATVDTSGSVTYSLTDALGSTLATANATGALGNNLSYEPYGAINGVIPSSFPFGFAGTYNVSGNIFYNRARYYDAGTGRFLSEDPLGVKGGVNPYVYADDQPTDVTDPSGLLTVAVSGGGGITGIAAGAAGGSGVAFNTAGCVSGFTYTGAGTGNDFNGLYAGGGVQVSAIGGNSSYFGGLFTSYTLAVGIDLTAYFDGDGNFAGIGIGIGPSIGFTKQTTNTDLHNWAGKCGCK